VGKPQREKGARGERQVVGVLNATFSELGFDDLEAKRILTESREGSFDVEIVGLARGDIDPIIQVKNWKRTGLHRAFSEADTVESALGYPFGLITPVGVSRETVNGRREWVAALPLSHLAELIALAHGYRVTQD
jgi:hypothetical protein